MMRRLLALLAAVTLGSTLAYAQVAMPRVVAPKFAGAAPAAVTWSATNHGPNIVLSNGNLTATSSGPSFTPMIGWSDTALSGKKYFEVTIHPSTNNFTGVGVVSTGQSLANGQHIGRSSGSIGLMSNGEVRHGNVVQFTFTTPPVDGDVICVAYDATANIFWVRINNGNWNDNAANNPATGTGGRDVSADVTAPMYMAYSFDFDGSNPDSVTANFGPTFTYTPPSGYTAP